MIDDILEYNESIYSSSKDIIVKDIIFDAYLTNRKLILENIADGKIFQYDIDLIKKYQAESDKDGNPSINFFVTGSQNKTKNLILKFASNNQLRNYERDQWINSLNKIRPSDTGIHNNISSQDNSIFKTCSFCGSSIKCESNFCHRCGAKLNYCSDNKPSELPEVRVSEKSAKVKPKYIKETKCTCNSCGNVFYYGKKEVWENRSKICDNLAKEASAASCCYCNPFINATKNENTITDFNRCPNCGSKNVTKEEISHEI